MISYLLVNNYFIHHAQCRYEKREKYGFEPAALSLVLRYHLASLAQLVEHPSGIGNRKVSGSNLGRGNEFFISRKINYYHILNVVFPSPD